MLQRDVLARRRYRGERFRDHPRDVAGDPDLLNLTRPEVVLDIHRDYFAAGADITTTNTFTATTIGQADYGLEDAVYEMNVEGARLARQAADERGRPLRRRLDRPAQRHALALAARRRPGLPHAHVRPGRRDAYAEQIRGLVDGGVDLLLVETIFDTLNAKAAIAAALEARPSCRSGSRSPIDRPERPQALGPDGRGVLDGGRARRAARRRRQLLARRDRDAPVRGGALADRRHATSRCHPNAGLPNAFGGYDERPHDTSALLREFARGRARERRRRLLRHDARAHVSAIVGRGRRARAARDPDAASATRASAGSSRSRSAPTPASSWSASGRTSPARARFRRLVEAGDFAARVEVALEQVRGGANLLDVNMDADLLDGVEAMTTFLNLIATEPEVARLPIMVDSSRWAVLEAGLKCLQGKGVVNSISLKEGEEAFLEQARAVRRYGAAVVVMAFDEQGQADTVERKVAICGRAYDLLVERSRLRRRGRHLRPERARGRDGHRGARRVREGVHRGAAADQGALPRRAHLRRHLEPLLLVPRQRRRPRGDARGLPLPRDPGRARHGHRQRRPARGLRGHRRPSCSSASRT